MKKTILLIGTFLFLNACTSMQQTPQPRTPAQVNANMSVYASVRGVFTDTKVVSLKRGNVTIDLSSCNEKTIVVPGGGIPDYCEVSFSNFYAFLNPASYGLTHAKGWSLVLQNDNYRLVFSGSNLSADGIKSEIKEIVASAAASPKMYSVRDTKLTLVNVSYVSF
jgi:uncharacterized protein YcfL